MLKKITENVEIHQTLPDTPNLTSEELKKEWDKGNKIIKEKFNELIDSLNDAEVLELKEKIVGTVLYEDDAGTTGDITLNDAIENYKYFEIESYASFSGILSYANTGKLPIATKGRVHVNNNFVGASVVQLYCKRVELSGTSMHVVSDRIFTDQTITNGEYTYITKITGYKEV